MGWEGTQEQKEGVLGGRGADFHLGGFEESAVSSRASRFGGAVRAGETVEYHRSTGIRGHRRE